MVNCLTDQHRLSHRRETREQLWGPGTPFSSLRLDRTAHVPVVWGGGRLCCLCRRTEGETRSQAGRGEGSHRSRPPPGATAPQLHEHCSLEAEACKGGQSRPRLGGVGSSVPRPGLDWPVLRQPPPKVRENHLCRL